LFASERLDYPSPFGMAPLNHCRQTDGSSRVEWECATPKADGNVLRFEFPVAIGFKSQPAGEFTLQVNGKKSFDFDVTLQDAMWMSVGGARATYRVYERNGEDSSGVLTIELPAHSIAADQPVRFTVTAGAANSQRWFGIYTLDSRDVVKR
jgi:hypothetical protein